MIKYTVLVAEDDPDDRFLLRKAFEENGFHEILRFVEDGEELMEYLAGIANKKIWDAIFPAFILLDLNMPRKDGRSTLQEIKQHPAYRKIPTLVFTTNNTKQEIDHCYQLGANSYIIKPASFIKLVKMVQDIHEYWFKTAALIPARL